MAVPEQLTLTLVAFEVLQLTASGVPVVTYPEVNETLLTAGAATTWNEPLAVADRPAAFVPVTVQVVVPVPVGVSGTVKAVD